MQEPIDLPEGQIHWTSLLVADHDTLIALACFLVRIALFILAQTARVFVTVKMHSHSKHNVTYNAKQQLKIC